VPTRWSHAVVREVAHPLPRAVVLRLEVPERIDHRPGQHYVVRLTSEDGYRASRSYSVASAPSDPLVELFIERLDDGEVSTYLADAVAAGDDLEVRGPIGGWFAWDGDTPAAGIGGGSGVVPLVAMLRHAVDLGRADLLRLVVAARSRAQLPYFDELAAAGAGLAFSRAPNPTGRPAGRIAVADVEPVLRPDATTFVCGSAGFAEHATRLLGELGVPAPAIRVERFGPSAG
jgi:ferredoxin-NADP reductase